MNTVMKSSEIIQQLDSDSTYIVSHKLNLNQETNPEINKVQSIDNAQPVDISYIGKNKFAAFVSKTIASALILPLNEQLQKQADERGIAWIANTKPRLLFTK